jgi:hypothetical protein
LAADAVGEEGKPGYIPAVTEVKATVGKTLVNLNGTHYTDNGVEVYPDSCKVLGRIFGCNDINGSPLDSATVHIYKTAGASRTPQKDLDDIDDSKHHYHIQAVYGGGNLAAFVPSDANMNTATTHVIIDGCDMTSIKQVYGGGNAASTPATLVDVNGTYEIEEIFGGGNGKDALPNGDPNPGANVGYKAYPDDANYETRNSDTWTYGLGAARVNIFGGKIHRVYGGSNTKGNVRQMALTLLDGQEECDFNIDEAYGGGKSAPMDGAAKLEMACIPGLKVAYGGAEEAEIHGDVTLNITNGTFDRVFGGNNVQGKIYGTITVNIEETGCRPVIIGQLFGGGNQAPYEQADPTRPGPTINVRSFTSIGDIYGGGYGETATVKGDTYVNINVCDGKFANQDTDEDLTVNKTSITFMQFKRTTDTTEDPNGFVYKTDNSLITEENPKGYVYQQDGNGNNLLDEQGNPIKIRETEPKTINIKLPPHAAGDIGSINNVFGGGWAAKVDGNTNVCIGTTTQEVFVTPVKKTVNNEEVETTDAERTHTVKGASIIGNVYGGGNEAEVTGRTNVIIGKDISAPAPSTTTPAPVAPSAETSESTVTP